MHFRLKFFFYVALVPFSAEVSNEIYFPIMSLTEEMVDMKKRLNLEGKLMIGSFVFCFAFLWHLSDR